MTKLRPILLPYDRTSLSAKAVSRHFKTKRIFANGKFKPTERDVIINWGFIFLKQKYNTIDGFPYYGWNDDRKYVG